MLDVIHDTCYNGIDTNVVDYPTSVLGCVMVTGYTSCRQAGERSDLDRIQVSRWVAGPIDVDLGTVQNPGYRQQRSKM